MWSACGVVLAQIWVCQEQILKRRVKHILQKISSNDCIPAHATDGLLGKQHIVVMYFDCTMVLMLQAGHRHFSPLHLPSQPACKHGLMCLKVAELLGWQGDGTYALFLQMMIDIACFWVKCYLPIPAHSHDSTASSTFKFRCPDSPTKLFFMLQNLLCCQVRPHWNCCLWGKAHRCHTHHWEYAGVNPNYAPARCIWTPTAINYFYFFSTLRPFSPCVNPVQQSLDWET